MHKGRALPTAAGPEKVEKVGLSVQFFRHFFLSPFLSSHLLIVCRFVKLGLPFFYFVLVIKEFGEGTHFEVLNSDQIVMIPL